MERVALSSAFFDMSLEFLNESSPDKKINFSLLPKALGKERPPKFPQTGPRMETDAHFQSLT